MRNPQTAVQAVSPRPAPASPRARVVKLIYQSYLPFQGRYPRVSGQAKILRDRGYRVTVLACDREAVHPVKETLEGIEVERIHIKTAEHRGLRQVIPLLRFWWRAWQWLKREEFDVLHCHNLDVIPVGWWVQTRKQRPAVFDAHEPNYYALWPGKWKALLQIVNRIERWFSRRLAGVSVTNEYQVEKFQAMGAQRVELMGNYPLPELRIESIPEIKFKRSEVTFGRLGTIYKNSGYEETIGAIEQVIEQSSDARFLIAGRAVDNYRRDFEKLIDPIRDRIERVGAFPAHEMPRLYEKMDVSLLIYPKSDWFREITPRKFFDSLANGVPVIMTDIGRLGIVIREYECGVVVDENDTAGIAKAMLDLVQDAAKRRSMSVNALELSRSKFSWEQMADKYDRYQQQLILSQRRPSNGQ